MQAEKALLYAARARELLFRLFLGSSAVEHSTVNRMVAGSNPARGANMALSKGHHAVATSTPPLDSAMSIPDFPSMVETRDLLRLNRG